MEVSYRRRINVSISTKGVLTFDCTVESENAILIELLRESDLLVDELKKRYPVKGE